MIETDGVGTFEGKRVDEARLVSETGVEMAFLNWGCVVRDWRVPVADGLRQVVLGFESFEPYPEHSPHFGAICGRVANRIAGARFVLDGDIYELDANEAGHCLHGGFSGLSRRVWDMDVDARANAVRFVHESPHLDSGFPGAVRIEATYTLKGNRLELELEGHVDRPAPLSLVQHHYFNLGLGPDVLDHTVRIDASAYTPLGPTLATTGEIRPVDGTRYDLRTGRNLRDQSGNPIDFDMNLVLPTRRDVAVPLAEVTGPDGALCLRLWSDRPAVQIYNGVWTECTVPGHGGRTYGRHSGLCLEDQFYPGALSWKHFPSIIVTPDAPYRHSMAIEIA
ncbi:aldose epimerase family protein [Pelagibacterium montanilacus]|uniref:aldose epimerase family protein n=1 Tax=Pelagibacterium montanilacus TaxID=2185280 RepID=UPI000F8F2D87|nr:aldose epimerase family protein [Pelagibacterium montanilacus]